MTNFDAAIASCYCLKGLTTNRCTLAEALGLYATLLFYCSLVVVTIVHVLQQQRSGSIARNEEATRRANADKGGSDTKMMITLVSYFFFVAGGLSALRC